MGILYIVATPIGNLSDITYRAVKVLKEVDLIACEDTRHSKILLDNYQIKTPTISYHQHSKISKIEYLIEQLKSGKNIALITDAGTPGISDPGSILISEALKFTPEVVENTPKVKEVPHLGSGIDERIKVVPIPGPAAVTTALSASGLPNHSFLFLGFLPKKKGRQTLFRNLMKVSNLELYQLIVIYESPYRLIRTLQDLQLVVGNKDVAICREMTKKFEEIYHGNIYQAIKHFQKNSPKSQFTIIIKT